MKSTKSKTVKNFFYVDEDVAVLMDGQLLIDCCPVWTCLKTISRLCASQGQAKKETLEQQTTNKQTAKMDPLLPPGSLACLLCKGAVSLRFVGFIWLNRWHKYSNILCLDWRQVFIPIITFNTQTKKKQKKQKNWSKQIIDLIQIQLREGNLSKVKSHLETVHDSFYRFLLHIQISQNI